MTQHSKEVTAESFAIDVLEASKRVPVVVDFWAPWCAPCRALKPVLEKLAAEYGGQFVLAKVNTDENAAIASQFGVRGIPSVMGFRDGSVAAEFTGALPESAVRAFLGKLIPSAGERLRLAAAAATAAGDFEAAESRLRDALDIEPRNRVARLDLAELLIARQAWSEADLVLRDIPEHEMEDRARQLSSRVAVWKKALTLPGIADLRAALERSPQDLELRLKFSDRCVADGDLEAALESLLVVVRADRGILRDRARKAMLEVFSMAGAEAEMVGRYRKLLASALY